ncbi:DUF4179 domain-containing protein [Paenibacillus sp. GCM10023250]|uniref:DUF4179 domain-containing protein n=1 Tax=Paenibacillus sp. GCM10023250 TaxID=3252648 RepID=UPI00361B9228
MEKWERYVRQHVNRPLPEAVDQRIQQTLDALKPARKRASGRRRLAGTVAAATAAIAIVVSVSSMSPAIAEAMRSLPLIGSVLELVGDAGMKRGSELRLASTVDRQVRIGDEEIRFTESLYDGSSILLAWVAQDADRDPYAFMNDVVYAVNGKPLTYSGSAPAIKLEDGTYAGAISIRAADPLPDKFQLELRSREDGSVYARLPVERRGHYRTASISKTGTWNGIGMKYHALSLYPTATELTFGLSHADLNEAAVLKFKVSDERGYVLNGSGSFAYRAAGSPKESGEYAYFFDPFETVPEQIEITPYISTAYSTVRVDGTWKGTPIALDQGAIGSVLVVDQSLEDRTLTLVCDVTGEQLDEQINRIGVEDGNGNALPRVSPPVRIQGRAHAYELKFGDVDRGDVIRITSPVFNPTTYLRDLSVTVQVPATEGGSG